MTYDVNTEVAAGRRRLRRVAKVCEAYGQRVQKSVFECVLNAVQFQELRYKLVEEIDESQDSLRFYRLREPRSRYLEVYGMPPEFDIREPLIL